MMRVYVLRLENLGRLTRAFDRVLDASDVASCMIEPEHSQLRFLAPERRAEKLVEQIYNDGGLVWCSQHDVEAEAE
jgi:hypothetical protein